MSIAGAGYKAVSEVMTKTTTDIPASESPRGPNMARCAWIFLMIAARIVLAQPNRPAEESNHNTCVVDQVPTDWASDTPLAVIERHSVLFTEMGRVVPTFVFRNLQPDVCPTILYMD